MFVLRMAWRETRASWGRLLFFFTCVAIGVAAIVVLRSVIQTVRTTLTREARLLIGADVVIQAQRPWANELAPRLAKVLDDPRVLAHTNVVETQTMAQPAGGKGTGALRLVEVRGIEAAFPFYGAPELEGGKRMGFEVLRALDFRDGFTHMEWYRKADGEVVFGEIGGRPPGARTVDVMNFANDSDLYLGWAEAVLHGRMSRPVERKYNACSIFKRAQGRGRIQRIEGLNRLMAEFGEHIACVDLLPIGAPRRDPMQTLVSDGLVVVRHPDLASTIYITDRVCTDLQLYAG